MSTLRHILGSALLAAALLALPLRADVDQRNGVAITTASTINGHTPIPTINGQTVVSGGGGDVIAPTITSVTISADGTTWTIAHDEPVSFGAGGSGGLEVWMEYVGEVTLTYSSGIGTANLVFTGSPAVRIDEPTAAGLNYTQPGDGIEDAAGNDLASASGEAVTNNSTQALRVFQNFEGTGFDNSESWTKNTATDGTVDEDYTAEALVGTQSARLSEATGGDVSAFIEWAAATGAVNGMVVFQVDSWDGGTLTARSICYFAPSGSTTSTGAIRGNFTATTMAPLARIATTNGTATTDTITHGTTVWLWWSYDNTTDVVHVWWNTTSVKPDSGSSKHSSATVTVSATVQRLFLIQDEPGSAFLFDKAVVW